MKQSYALYKVYFKSLLLTSFSFGRSKKKTASSLLAFVFLILFMGGMSTIYSVSLGMQMAAVGELKFLLFLMGIIGLFFASILILYSAQSQIFSIKDMDLVLSFPVSSFSVMLSRIMALYIETLLAVSLFFLPAGVVYVALGGIGGAAAAIIFLLCALPMSLLPCMLALLFAFFVSFVVGRFRYKNMLTIILSLGLLGGFLFVYFRAIGRIQTTTAMIDFTGMYARFASNFIPMKWAVEAAAYHSIGTYILLFLLCGAPFFLLVFLFGFKFKKILTLLSSYQQKNDYKLTTVKHNNVFIALLKKEFHRFFLTPMYFLNSGVGILMAIGGSVYVVIARESLQKQLLAQPMFSEWIPSIVLLGLLLLLSMSYASAVSISLEGKNLWILKSAPVSIKMIFGAKSSLGFLLGAFMITVCVPLLALGLQLSLLDALIIALCGYLAALQTGLSGVYINLLFPKLDADNDTIVVKQSASVIVSMLFSMSFTGLYFLIIVGLSFMQVPFALQGVCVSLLLVASCVLFYRLLLKSGVERFNKL